MIPQGYIKEISMRIQRNLNYSQDLIKLRKQKYQPIRIKYKMSIQSPTIQKKIKLFRRKSRRK